MSPLAVLSGAGWRLVFEQQLDRIQHRLEVQAAGQWHMLIESIEGVASQWWPPSPPLQSLHVESRPSGNVALLVGMSGRSHWSASVEIAEDGLEAIFDIACRVAEPPDWLGSRYADRSHAVGAYEVRFRGLDPQPPRMARPAQDEIEIYAPRPTGDWPRTVRWRYAVGVGNAPGKPGG